MRDHYKSYRQGKAREAVINWAADTIIGGVTIAVVTAAILSLLVFYCTE